MRTFDDLLIDAGSELDECCANVAAAPRPAASGPPRTRAVAATAAVALVAVSGAVFWAVRETDAPGSTVKATTSSTPPMSVDPTSIPVPTVPLNMPIADPISKGSTGDDVRRVEQRLNDLGFFVGDVDGQFDDQTEQAVWAFKQLVGGVFWQSFEHDESKAIITPDIWLQMSEPVEIVPRRPTGDSSTHVEIYLPLQVLVVFTADQPVLIAHISSGELDGDGNPIMFCETLTIDTDVDGQTLDPPREQAFCAETKTPGGVFEINRRVDGRRAGPLGDAYRPQYFNYVIAIHGAANVPSIPASHGNVRVTTGAADELWRILSPADKVYVWGQDGKEPENYTNAESLPSFSYADPKSTTP